MDELTKIVWCIGGSDSGGGAGIQADVLSVKDLTAHACSVISAVTAQNSRSVEAVFALSPQQLISQLNALWQDLPPAAIKIGMLADDRQLMAVADWLKQHQPDCPVVWDPVLIASTGRCLSDISWQSCQHLLPLISLLTPNLPELAFLANAVRQAPSADSEEAITQLAVLRTIYHGAILLKGGHATSDNLLCDVLSYDPLSAAVLLHSPRIRTAHHHGTGCTLASAIAALLAQQYELPDAVVVARAYLQQSLRTSYATGQGAGCLGRGGWPLQQQDFPSVTMASLLPDATFTPPEVTQHLASAAPLVTQSAAVGVTWSAQTLKFPRLMQSIGLYPVLDDISWLKRLLPLGLHTVQLRLKDKSESTLREQIAAAVEFCRDYQIQLFINDHWQLAIDYQAFGVHLGQEDLQHADLTAIAAAGLRLGVSTHGYAELATVLRLKPSYIALGHIFPTQTKQMPSKPQGLKRLSDYVWLCEDIPTVAIGGINKDNIFDVLQTGVRGIAVVSAITKAAHPETALRQLQSCCQPLLEPVVRGSYGSWHGVN